MTRPKNVNVKKRLTRIVPMRNTKLAIALFYDQYCNRSTIEDSLHRDVVKALRRVISRTIGTSKLTKWAGSLMNRILGVC